MLRETIAPLVDRARRAVVTIVHAPSVEVAARHGVRGKSWPESTETWPPPVRLTRKTLLELFRGLGAKKAAIDNPQEWATTAVRILKEKLADHLVDGIQYEKTGDSYKQSLIIIDEKDWDRNAVELFCKYAHKPKTDQAV